MRLKKGPKRMPACSLVPSKWTLASCNDIKSFFCDLSLLSLKRDGHLQGGQRDYKI